MRLEYYPESKLRQEILTILAKHLDVSKYKVFYFGSRVTDKGSDRSDIDIGIEGQNPIPLSTISKIKEEIEELPILYCIDIVDFGTVSDDFRQVAMEKVECIN